MGAWGYGPFQNDAILDDLGGFTHPLRLKIDLEKAFNCEYYYGSYEVAALLLSTYEQGLKYNYLVDSEIAKKLLKLLNKDTFNKSDMSILCESRETWLSACALDLQERKDILQRACIELNKLINNPKLASNYSAKDKEELISNMKDVYNAASKVMNDGFPKPIFIPTSMYTKLENAYKKKRLIDCGDKNLEVLSVASGKFRIADRHRHCAWFNEQELMKFITEDKIPRPTKDDGVMFMALNKYFEIADKQKKSVAQAICIDKVYKGNKITHYVIQDLQGRQACVETEIIKDAMINHGLLVKNLKVTSDKRIISVKR